MSLTLSVQNDDEITLPAGIAVSSLSLAEIGAVVVMACLQHEQPDQDGLAARMNSEEMMTASQSLKNKDILKIGMSEGKLSINIDLEAVGL